MSEPFDGAAATEALKVIFDEIPKRLGISAIVADAHERIVAACPNAPQAFVAQKLVEVLREIATVAVEHFTKKTGEQFTWVDEPEFNAETDDVIMTFALDAKGNVVFGGEET